jgi:hypothetical protein
MAAIVIDSLRWREGWGEAPRDGWGEPLRRPAPAPALRLVGTGTRRPGAAVLRRRRLALVVVVGLLLAVVLAVASMALTRPASAGSVAPARRTHLVQAGETYWSIAGRYEHEGDLRVAVDRLIDANGARPLFAGDRIELP